MWTEGADDVAKSIGVYKNAKAEAYVDALGKRLSQETPRKNLPWQFHIVDDPYQPKIAVVSPIPLTPAGALASLLR